MYVFYRSDIDQKYVFFIDSCQILKLFWYYMVLFEYIFSLALLNLKHNQIEAV